eukprot:g12110.t1
MNSSAGGVGISVGTGGSAKQSAGGVGISVGTADQECAHIFHSGVIKRPLNKNINVVEDSQVKHTPEMVEDKKLGMVVLKKTTMHLSSLDFLSLMRTNITGTGTIPACNDIANTNSSRTIRPPQAIHHWHARITLVTA